MDALLQYVPERLHEHVGVTARRAAADDAAWCRRLLGKAGDVLGPNLAFTVAAIAPTLPYERVRLLIRLSMWFYLLDDRQDDPAVSTAEVSALGQIVGAALAGDPTPDADVLPQALAALHAELASHDPQRRVLPRVEESVRDGVAAGVEHALLGRLVAAGKVGAPTVEEYLELAVRHILYRSFALALVLLVGDTLDAEELNDTQLDVVDVALRSGSLAVRLANDLRSQARERAEGTLNALDLCISDVAPVREQSVRQRIAQAVRAHDAQLERVAAPLRDALVTSLRVSVAVYGIGDLR